MARVGAVYRALSGLDVVIYVDVVEEYVGIAEVEVEPVYLVADAE